MIATPAVRSLIRDSRTHQLATTLETSAKDGMITMRKALDNLYEKNMISTQEIQRRKKLADDAFARRFAAVLEQHETSKYAAN